MSGPGISNSWFDEVLALGSVWWLACLAVLPGLPGVGRGDFSAYEVVGWGLVVLALAKQWLRQGRLFPVTPAFCFGAAFFGWLIGWTGWIGATETRPLVLALALFVAGASLSPRAIRRFPLALYWVGWMLLGVHCLEALDLLPSSILHRWRQQVFWYFGFARVSGTFFHPNLYAFILLLVWLSGLSLIRARRVGGRSTRFLHLFSFCIMAVLSLTLSRGVMIGSGLLALFLIMLRSGRRRYVRPGFTYALIGALGFLYAAVALSSEVWKERLFQSSEEMGRAIIARHGHAPSPGEGGRFDPRFPGPGTLEDRLSFAKIDQQGREEIWREARGMWRQSPWFGVGVGGFFVFGRGHLHSHNFLLELLLSGGLFGIVLLFACSGWAIRGVRGLRWWHLVLVSIATTGLFDCFLFFRLPLLIGAFALGIWVRGDLRAWVRHPRPVADLLTRITFRLESVPRWAIMAGAAFFLIFALVVGHEVAQRPSIDFFTYYVSTQFTLETGMLPYVAWPSVLMVPPDHPLGVYSLERHGLIPLRFFYPPTSLVIFAPFAWIEQAKAAGLIWYAFELLLLAPGVWGAWELSRRRAPFWLLVLIFLAFSPLRDSIFYGQVSWPLGVLALWIWVLHRGGRSFAAGCLLAFGVCMKVFPVLWLGFLIVKRKGAVRMLLGLTMGCAVLAIASIHLFGWESWAAYGRWVLRPLDAYPPGGPNISIRGLAVHYGVQNLELFRRIALAILGVLFILGLGFLRFRREPPDVSAMGVVALSVLAAPIAWPHYGCLLVGFLAAFIARAAMDGTRGYPEVLLGIGVFLLVGMGSFGSNPMENAFRASLGFLAAIAFPFLLYLLTKQERPISSVEQPQ